MNFYTLDRLKKLEENMNLENFDVMKMAPHLLMDVKDILTAEESIHYFNSNFNSGLSRHGLAYLMNPTLLLENNKLNIDPSIIIEIIFELVRQVSFSNLPSRFQCMFAFQSIEDVKGLFGENFCSIGNIHEIEAEEFFLGDLNLLKLPVNVISALAIANKYWSGGLSDNPLVEVLLPLPIKIGKKIAI